LRGGGEDTYEGLEELRDGEGRVGGGDEKGKKMREVRNGEKNEEGDKNGEMSKVKSEEREGGKKSWREGNGGTRDNGDLGMDPLAAGSTLPYPGTSVRWTVHIHTVWAGREASFWREDRSGREGSFGARLLMVDGSD